MTTDSAEQTIALVLDLIGERERANLVVRTARFIYGRRPVDRVRRVSAHARLLCMLHACVLV